MKILLVDDEPAILKYVGGLLASVGHEVISRLQTDEASARDILSLVELWKFDVIMLDIVMPGMDGYQMARLIRPSSPASYLLMHGVWIEMGEKAVETGVADAYLPLPVEKEQLRDALRIAQEKIGHNNCAVRARDVNITDLQEAIHQDELTQIRGRLNLKTIFPLALVLCFAVVQITRFGKIHDYLFMIGASFLSMAAVFGYSMIPVLSHGRKSWGLFFLAMGGWIPYLFGCYLSLYEGFWAAKGLLAHFSVSDLALRVGFVVVGWYVVNGFYGVTAFVKMQRVSAQQHQA